MKYEDFITVVTSTSAIPSCPSTKIIDMAYESLRKQLPKVKMLLLTDGYTPKNDQIHNDNSNYNLVRVVEQKNYETYKNVLSKRIASKEWTDVEIVNFDTPHHQAGMVQYALQNHLVKTPLLMFQEHDYYFLDRLINWNGIVQTLLDKNLSLVRFSNDSPERWNREGWRHYGKTICFNDTQFKEAFHFYAVLCIGRTDFFEWVVTAFDKLWHLNHQDPKKNLLECFTTQSFYELEGRNIHPIGLYLPEGDNGDNQRIFTNDGRNAL